MGSDIIWFTIGGLILHYVILMLVISAATSNKRKDKLLAAQVDLLIKIAYKQGVPEDEIDGVISQMNS